ncbi:plasmid mobilization protein [Paenibacillus brasilensis]|uniref:Bacterial mobilisation domain-containing protein n=1 Tax=Paenibacillus brasilensis TaxID=128574 RepID=A0ABU0L6M9_9BACL|nr:plasmid mobilization relaxosome protein MobC [Paenibacillus brasilensis]MDQ0496880.1 hypothetical protein [Paenibacillus brasilensis]
MAKKRIRDKEVKFFVTAAELELIDKKAEVAELDRSKYCRQMTLDGLIIKQDFKQVDDLVYVVNKIGNNINQIARRANEVEYVSLDDIKYLKKQLEGIYSQIERFYDGG